MSHFLCIYLVHSNMHLVPMLYEHKQRTLLSRGDLKLFKLTSSISRNTGAAAPRASENDWNAGPIEPKNLIHVEKTETICMKTGIISLFLYWLVIWITYDKNITQIKDTLTFVRHKKRAKNKANRINDIWYKWYPSEKNAKYTTLSYIIPLSWSQLFFISKYNKHNNIFYDTLLINYFCRFIYRFCSYLPPLSERTVRNELNTSSTICPTFEYAFNPFLSSLVKTYYENLCHFNWLNNNPYPAKYHWATNNKRYNTHHD
jgi:hypothetical protein